MKGFLKKAGFILAIVIIVSLIVKYSGSGSNDATNYADNFITLGMTDYASGNYAEAIQNFDQAIELNPNDAGAYKYRGTANGALGNYTSAIQDFDKAIELDPGSAVAYQSRGFAKIKLNRIDEGCNDLRKSKDFGNESAIDMITQYCN